QLASALEVPEHGLGVLFEFEQAPLRRKFHADAEHVIFAFHHIRHPDAPLKLGPDAIDPVEVHVLVHGDYLVTVHTEEAALQPPKDEAPAARRGEKYLVFTALLEMTSTLFEALANVAEEIEELERGLALGQFNPASDREKIPVLRARLTTLRRVAGRQQGLFT